MRIYKTFTPGKIPFVLIGRTMGRGQTWANQNRADNRADGGKPVDLPIVDALGLAKLHKLSVIHLSNPDRLHVVGIGGKAYFKKKEIGFVEVDIANDFDEVKRAVTSGELFACEGFAHDVPLKSEPQAYRTAGQVQS